MQKETLDKSGNLTHTRSNCTVTVVLREILRLLDSAARFKILIWLAFELWTAKAKRRIGTMRFVFLYLSCKVFMCILTKAFIQSSVIKEHQSSLTQQQWKVCNFYGCNRNVGPLATLKKRGCSISQARSLSFWPCHWSPSVSLLSPLINALSLLLSSEPTCFVLSSNRRSGSKIRPSDSAQFCLLVLSFVHRLSSRSMYSNAANTWPVERNNISEPE